MVRLVLRYDGNPTTTGTIAGISLPPLVYLIKYKRLYHYNDNHMCLLKEMSAFNYFVSKGNWVKEDRNREALPKGKLAA